jgi:hypothetical protein
MPYVESIEDEGDSAVGLLIDSIAVSRESTYDESVNIAPEADRRSCSSRAARGTPYLIDANPFNRDAAAEGTGLFRIR